ncbi:response regulator [Xylophilus rhododendri]|uniref:Response regulator n=1 Tax=Xylophilus rhododendri TaxID=2697032 RepID=A0A857J1Z8_9BURK|nr:response regulator [Xylophilus rhododendri]QHI97101.1 response regulator [Xylophilus rhododendri]
MPHSKRAFLVEDNPSLRESLIELLKSEASVAVIATAENEIDAINWLAVYSHRVSLVILDMYLTSGTGLSILRQMRDAGLTHPIVVFTNSSSQALRDACLRGGADAFFDKGSEQELFFSYVRGEVKTLAAAK